MLIKSSGISRTPDKVSLFLIWCPAAVPQGISFINPRTPFSQPAHLSKMTPTATNRNLRAAVFSQKTNCGDPASQATSKPTHSPLKTYTACRVSYLSLTVQMRLAVLIIAMPNIDRGCTGPCAVSRDREVHRCHTAELTQ